MQVELCMSGAAPARLVYGARAAAAFVRRPRLLSQAGAQLPEPRPLVLEAEHIVLAGVGADACIAYDVDLQAALDRDLLLMAYPTDGALITSVELFLWRPTRRPAGMRARARFELPPGMRVDVPWESRLGEYRLDESVFAFTGHAVFGHFERHSIPVPSGTIDAVVPAGFSAEQHGFIRDWLATAGAVVSLATGRFPVTRAQVIVLPTAPSASPIRFGHTGRSGGASVVIFVPTDVDLPVLRSDWIAIHEFCHLLHPFVRRKDAWLSEGLATYLQELLRVRAGLISADSAWQRLYEGALLGRDAEGDLGAETQRMSYAGNYERVYWAGAAIALMADVELRRRSAGAITLERTLAQLAHDRVVMSAPASAASLIAALDRASRALAAAQGSRLEPGELDVFRALADRYLVGALPDLAPLYRELGLLDARGGVRSAPDAPLAAIRAAIGSQALEPSSLPLWRSTERDSGARK